MIQREGAEKPSRTRRFYQRGCNMPEGLTQDPPNRQQLTAKGVAMDMSERKILG